MKYVLRLALIAVVLAGCERDPLGFDYVDNYSLAILQGGDGGVYFMPPLLHSSFSGEFAPDRNPVVVICAGAPAAPCASPVATLDMTRDAGEDASEVVEVNTRSEKYTVNWKAAHEARGLYRIFVVEDGEWLAYIDAALTKGRPSSGGNGRGVRVYGADATREFTGTLPIAFRMEVQEEPEPVNGLLGEYFDWSALESPDFALAVPIVERLDPVIDFVDANGDSDGFSVGRNETVMARWSGFIVPEAGDFYTLCVEADDGVVLRVNGFPFIERWVDSSAPSTHCASLYMEAGSRNAVTLEWYQATGGAAMRLFWETNPDNRTIIPTAVLWPN